MKGDEGKPQVTATENPLTKAGVCFYTSVAPRIYTTSIIDCYRGSHWEAICQGHVKGWENNQIKALVSLLCPPISPQRSTHRVVVFF